MDNAKINSLLSELKRLKAKQEGGITAELIFDLTQKLEGVKELEKKFEDTVKEIKASVPNLDTMFKSVKGNTGDQGERGEKGEQGEKGDSITGPNGKDGLNGKDGRDGRDGIDGINGVNGIDGAPVDEISIIATIENDLPKLGERIRDGLELLEDEDKLSIKAIKDLEDKLKNLEKKIKMGGQMIYAGGGSGSGGRIVKALDLSAELNGSTRVFNTQAFWRPISVHLSSFPNILRETTDFTWTPTSLTLTSEVSDIAISAGQTLIFVIAE